MVTLENIGVQQTIFDQYDTPAYAGRRAEAAVLLEDQLGGVGNEMLLRLCDLDPRLGDTIHAALGAFESAETAEHRAQVALALRRLLEKFANAVFPPTAEAQKGRKLGPAEYRNRLWAYVEHHESGSHRDATVSALQDVGSRIDKLNDLVNAGLHAEVDPTELQRLLIAVIALLYDLLLLAPPPTTVPDTPYVEGILRTTQELLTEDE